MPTRNHVVVGLTTYHEATTKEPRNILVPISFRLFSFFETTFYRKIIGFSGIRAWTARFEG